MLNRGLNLKCSEQTCHEVCDLPFVGIIFIKRSFVFESNAGKYHRLTLQGEVRQLWWSSCPCWLWTALGCMLSCLRSSCKWASRPFLTPCEGYFMDEGLSTETSNCSIKHQAYRQQSSVRAVPAGNFCHCFFVTLRCCLFEALTYSFFFIQLSKSFVFFVVPYFCLSLAKLGV